MNRYPIHQLYEFTPKVETTSARHNPLTSAGALNEAEFIDLRLSPQRSRVGILFDTRMCGEFQGSNAALIVSTGVRKAQWSNDGWTRQQPWHAQYGSLASRTSTSVRAPFPPGPAEGKDMWALDAADASNEATLSLSTTARSETNSISPEYILEFGSLSVSSLKVQIYIGHIDVLGMGIPDMTELSDTEIIAGFPQWSSQMEVREYYSYSP